MTLDAKSECHADVSVQGGCQAKCKLPNCDIRAKCEMGKLVVACNGECSGACEVQAPSATCTGTCSGKCSADVAVACNGSCTGDCSDLRELAPQVLTSIVRRYLQRRLRSQRRG